MKVGVLAASQSEEDQLIITVGIQSGRSLIPSPDLNQIRVASSKRRQRKQYLEDAVW